MFKRVIVLVLLISLVGALGAEACLTADCCLQLFRAQMRACYQEYLTTVIPPCLTALLACGCTLAPVVTGICASGCITATIGCIATLLSANLTYKRCTGLAKLQRDICLESVIAECV